VVELRDGEFHEYQLSPASFGISAGSIHALEGGDADYNAMLLKRVLAGVATQAQLNAVAVSVASLLYLSDRFNNLKEATEAALTHLVEKQALVHLEALQEFNRG
jgi:anthranilate phosphoribosyltransferase